MSDSSNLTNGEKQWLLAVSGGPLNKATAERCIPSDVIDRLIAKRLVRWEIGLLSITAKGEIVVAFLRALQG